MLKRYDIAVHLCIIIILLCFSGCKISRPHCYLCGGPTYEAPCVVDLTNGDVAELLPIEDAGHVVWKSYHNIMVDLRPDEPAIATVPDTPQDASVKLFCDDCLAAINAVPHSGFVLADLHDLDNIQLYPIKDDMRFSISKYEVSIVSSEISNELTIEVQG